MQLSALVLALALAAAQAAPGPMRARLSPLPTDIAMQETIAGLGAATSTLAGTTLTVEGTYRGLMSPATSVRVYEARGRGCAVRSWASSRRAAARPARSRARSRSRANSRPPTRKACSTCRCRARKRLTAICGGWLMAPKGRR